MGEALIRGVPFRVDPESVDCGFKTKISAVDTVGGRVIQVLGLSFDSLSVSGSFGRGGRDEQRAFLQSMTAMAVFQGSLPEGEEIHFKWPERGWDFSVRLAAYMTPDGPMSVHVEANLVNPRWMLAFTIIDDFGTLKTAAPGEDAFISRLAAGIGWKQTVYNGPIPDWRTQYTGLGILSHQ